MVATKAVLATIAYFSSNIAINSPLIFSNIFDIIPLADVDTAASIQSCISLLLRPDPSDPEPFPHVIISILEILMRQNQHQIVELSWTYIPISFQFLRNFVTFHDSRVDPVIPVVRTHTTFHTYLYAI